MKAAQLERLQEHPLKLRLIKSQERLEALLQEAADKELSDADFLDQLLGEELKSKIAKNIAMRTNLHASPSSKGWRIATRPAQKSNNEVAESLVNLDC